MASALPRPLPFRENAIVTRTKLGYYLDERRRADPSSKVGLFRDVLGFADPDALRAALIAHANQHPAVIFERRSYGVIWNVDGAMRGPSGRTTVVRTSWIINMGAMTPLNTTAFRLRAGGS